MLWLATEVAKFDQKESFIKQLYRLRLHKLIDKGSKAVFPHEALLTRVCKFCVGAKNAEKSGERHSCNSEGVVGVGKRELYMGSEGGDGGMGQEF